MIAAWNTAAPAAWPDMEPDVEGASLERLHLHGPPLTGLRAKIADPRWLVAWLLDPTGVRPHTRMGRLNIKADDARLLAAALYAGEGGREPEPRWRGGDARRGESLFASKGCRGCHAIDAGEIPPMPRVRHLAGIGAQARGAWLFEWLKSPRRINPQSAMPRIELTDEEIRHLVAFLLSHREGAGLVAAAPRPDSRVTPDEARELFERFDCARCHLVPGFQTVEPLRGWPAIPNACAPCHEPTDPASYRPETGELIPDPAATETILRNGRLLATYYNCRGCHRLEQRGGLIAEHLERKTFAPPSLDGAGARLQTSWLTEFLQHPATLRPWLQIRMPDYGFGDTEAALLAEYFAALANLPAADEPPRPAADGVSALGKRRFDHFKCIQCHPPGPATAPPQGVDPEDLSINLSLAGTRLRPSWVRSFLAEPKKIAGMHTRMPTVFYTVDGEPKVEQPERDIEAIAAYLFAMRDGANESGHPGP